MPPPRPDWNLPSGVTRALWEYATADHIATEYDEYFAYNQLFQFDEGVLLRHFTEPGRLVDLGCGTGRLLMPFARRGFQCVAVDLSLPMLVVVGEKAHRAGLAVDRVQANFVELDCLADNSVDYCIIMFSTLGMIRGAENRARVLAHARRIVRPGGMFVAHVHNRWFHLYDPQGRRWLLEGLLRRLRGSALEPGDKVFEYRRIPNMLLHSFTRREFRQLLGRARFNIREFIHLDATRQQPLARPWLLGAYRANGWIAVCD